MQHENFKLQLAGSIVKKQNVGITQGGQIWTLFTSDPDQFCMLINGREKPPTSGAPSACR
jgi:hypothetical protein